MKEIDLKNWKRREHFEFFSRMTSPFFGIVAEVECTEAFHYAKKNKISFFAYYLHCSMTAVNSVTEFRYRLLDGKVYEFDTIHAGATAARDDETFAFIFVPYTKDFNQFNTALNQELEEVKTSTGLRLNNDDLKHDLIRHSTLPWFSFSALMHPSNQNNKDSVPRITFGRATEKNGKRYLPVSVEVHHGLMDGIHIAKYLKEFERQLKHPIG